MPETKSRRSFWIPVTAVTLVLFSVAWWFVEPAPPRTVVIATGHPDGAYHRFGTRYAEVLRENGFDVEVRSTAGSVENLRLLREDPNVDVAIVQGGTAGAADDGLTTVCGLYVEPVWVLVRTDRIDTPGDLRDLRGRRIAVGAPGSGTRAAVDALLPLSGVTERDGATFVSLDGAKAADALIAGTVDAAILVRSATDPLVARLLGSEAIAPMPVARNEAYRRRLRAMSAVTLPRGVIDLERDLPGVDVPMVAPVAQLVVTSSLHDAVVPLLLEAARRTHEAGDVVTEPGRFPSTEYADLSVNRAAARWFRSGPSFLYRWLPFRVASVLDRCKVLLLPGLTLLFPLLKVAPPVIRWRIRSSIYQWYSVLRVIDEELRDGADEAEVRRHLDTLAGLRRELDEVSVPLSYMEEFYNLRLHLDLVRRGLETRLASFDEDVADGEGTVSLPRAA